MNRIDFFKSFNLIRDSVDPAKKEAFDLQYAVRSKNETAAMLLSLYLGIFGVDRFYVGDIGLGLGKLFTFGGAGIWIIVDWFLITSAARNKNIAIAGELKSLVR